MGCDIHMVLEKKVNGRWVNEPSVPPYDSRNYKLFGILAAVRSDEYDFISLPKGMPANASHEALELNKRWNGNGHSHSFLTLREIEDYAHWLETETQSRCVPFDNYDEWCKTRDYDKTEYHYEQYLWAINECRYVEEEDFLAARMLGKLEKSATVVISYERTLLDRMGSDFKVFIDGLRAASGGDPDSIRMVFLFDN